MHSVVYTYVPCNEQLQQLVIYDNKFMGIETLKILYTVHFLITTLIYIILNLHKTESTVK